MQDDDLTQDQADEIASALDLMSGQNADEVAALDDASSMVVDESPHGEQIVRQACLALARDGTRPTLKAVVTYLLSEGAASATVETIKPWVRRWRAEQWQSDSVQSLFHRYLQLNAEQQAAVRELIHSADARPEPLEQTDPIYEIKARLVDGRTTIDHAGRKTSAWVKYHGLMERHRLQLLELDITEIFKDGRRIMLRHWQR